MNTVPSSPTDKINNPSYYTKGEVSVADFIDAYELNFNRGNIVKYVVRAGHKQGEDAVMALLKAQWYLGREIIRAGHEQERIDQMLEGARPLVYDPEHYPEDRE